jgi:hypothetical protein
MSVDFTAYKVEMVRRSYKNGGGYLSPAEYYSPTALQPSSNVPVISSAPVPGWVRPPLAATNVIAPAGGSRRRGTRKVGGFAPAIMGSFVANAQTAAVPLALYALYSMIGLRKGAKNSTRKAKKSSNNAKKSVLNNSA